MNLEEAQREKERLHRKAWWEQAKYPHGPKNDVKFWLDLQDQARYTFLCEFIQALDVRNRPAPEGPPF